MRDLLKRSILLGLLILAASLFSAGKSSSSGLASARVIDDTLPHRPLGVYAKVNIEVAKKEFANAPDIHKNFRELYARLLANPAISGLTIGERWDHIQFANATYPDGYDFKYLDDAFAVANDYNKSVQLIITPGFVSPKWLLDKIPSCDGLFHSNELVPPNCGKATFEGFPEQQRSDGNAELPLPWNPVYQQAWADFLGNLNAKYSGNPAFVAIALAGPVGASDEMILPTSENVNAGTVQPSNLSVDDTWAALIQHCFPDGEYPLHSDQVFIDAWKTAIDTYESKFSGITLVLSPDNGKDLPEFGVTGPVKPLEHDDDHLLAGEDCSKTQSPLSCEAKAEVIQYFMSVSGSNGKATQVGGLTAASNDDPGNIGIGGVKLLTTWSPPPSPPFLGGAEFDHPVSGKRTQKVGCPIFQGGDPNTKCPDLSVEDAAYNVMAVFFNKTLAASYFKGTVPGYQKGTISDPPTPMHYLEVPYLDVEYANTHQCVSKPSDVIGYMSVQQMLDQAKHDLLGIADGTLPALDSTPPVTTTMLPAPTGLHGWYQRPTVVDFSATDDLSGVVRAEWSLDNQATWTPFECDRLHLRDDGVYHVLSRSTDLARNVEAPKLTIVMIDSTAPVTTATTHSVGGKRGQISVVVSFAASDNLSGVATTEYSLDNGSQWKTGTTLALNESGTYTIIFRSTDVAGNVEKRNSIKLNVNVNPPAQPR